MATRAFRARPLDIHRQLDIVRDLSLLDSTEGLPAVTRDVVHNHAALDADNEKPKMIERGGGQGDGAKEIPIPGVSRIPTYALDYLPTFRDRNTYLRGKGESGVVCVGGVGYADPSLVEYDMDSEDEGWLAEFNGDGQERLSWERFEAMVWKLEVHNAAATDRALTFAGASYMDRISLAACATTDHFPREEALQMLEESCAARDTVRAAVYEHWISKRRRTGKPLLRRLQAPTPPADQNPYNVFRPRERLNRPQTRRRRENNEDSLEKLRMIRQVGDYAAAARSKNPRRPVGMEDLPDAAPVTTNALFDFRNRKNKRRKKLGELPMLHAVSQLAPLPLPPQLALPFAAPVDLGGLTEEDAQLLTPHVRLPKAPAPAAHGSGARLLPRLGRGSRLIFDRCAPWASFEPGAPEAGEAAPLPADGKADGKPASPGARHRGAKHGGSGGGGGGGKHPHTAEAKAEAKGAEPKAEEGSTEASAAAGGEAAGGGDAAGAAATGEGSAAAGAPAAAALAGPIDPSRPLWEQANPYAEWLGRSDLAAEALARLTDQPGGEAAAPPATVVKFRVTGGGGGGGGATPGASAATPGGAAATPGTTAASARAAGAGQRGAGAAAGGAGARATPGTAGSAARGRATGRPPKAPYQRSNLGPPANGSS
eukprot:scaffold11.g3834.t1